MAILPTPEQWQALTAVERLNFRVTHSMNSSPGIRKILTRLGSIFGKGWVELWTSKVVLDHGFDNFKKIDPNKGLLLVVNHRTFFDHFAITARLFRLYGAHHNIYFPIRANFFYDSPLALLVNIPLAFGAMYPPIIRDKKRRHWNRFATDLMADLLTDSRNMIGYNPEGTRNRSPDPYALLPPKPGCGELIHRSNPNVVPVFLQGFPKKVFELARKNWFSATPPLVHMVMGEPLDFSEELKLEPSRKTYLTIAKKVMDSIHDLAQEEQKIRAKYQA